MKNEELTSAFSPRSSNLEPGVVFFNDHKFWEAHESWEQIWLSASGAHKRFLQGLIQLAAAYHHVQRGTYRGGIRLFDAALEKLAPFSPDYAGVDRASAVEAARGHRSRIAAGEHVESHEYPKLRVSSG